MDLQDILCHFLDRKNRLIAFPAKRKMKLYALVYYTSKFESHKKYTEKEVNSIINEYSAFNDPATIRRELYDNRFIDRYKDGSAYWLEENQPKLSDWGMEG
jgi:hypothetical protein